MTEFWTTADNIPTVPGAYVLVINLCEPVVARICGKPSASLAPGEYLYCGSAKGRGGLRGRLARLCMKELSLLKREWRKFPRDRGVRFCLQALRSCCLPRVSTVLRLNHPRLDLVRSIGVCP